MEQGYVSTSDLDEHEVINALDPRYWQKATALIRSRRHQGLSIPAQAEAGLIHETRSSPSSSRFLEQINQAPINGPTLSSANSSPSVYRADDLWSSLPSGSFLIVKTPKSGALSVEYSPSLRPALPHRPFPTATQFHMDDISLPLENHSDAPSSPLPPGSSIPLLSSFRSPVPDVKHNAAPGKDRELHSEGDHAPYPLSFTSTNSRIPSLTPPPATQSPRPVAWLLSPNRDSWRAASLQEQEPVLDPPLDLDLAGNSRRYSLRARQARQLNPYAFDKALYKQQLRHNPDAIVKMRSPGRHIRYSSDHEDEFVDEGKESDSQRTGDLGHLRPRKRRRTDSQSSLRGDESIGRVYRNHRDADRDSTGEVIQRRRTGIGQSEDVGKNRDVPRQRSIDRDWISGIFQVSGSENEEDSVLDFPLSTSTKPSRKQKLRDHTPVNPPTSDTLSPSHISLSSSHPSPSTSPTRDISYSAEEIPLPSPFSSPPRRSSSPRLRDPKVQSILHFGDALGSSSSSSSSDDTDVEELRPADVWDSSDIEELSSANETGPTFDRMEPRASPRRRRIRDTTAPNATHRQVRHGRSRPALRTGHREAPTGPRRSHHAGDAKLHHARNKKQRRVTNRQHSSRRPTSPKHRTHDPPIDIQVGGPKLKPDRSHRPHGNVSIIQPRGERLLSKWMERGAITIAVEEDFRQALAPLPVNRGKQLRQPVPIVVDRVHERTTYIDEYFSRAPASAEHTPHLRGPVPVPVHRRRIVADLKIPFLTAGREFASESYTRKGWLYELLSLILGRDAAEPLLTREIDGEHLWPSSSVHEVGGFLTAACNKYLALVQAPATTVSDEQSLQWFVDTHVICQLVSAISSKASDDDWDILWATVQECIDTLMGRLNTWLDASASATSLLDSKTFRLHWFCLELTLRIQCTRKKALEQMHITTLANRLTALMYRLLQFGMRRTMEPILSHRDDLNSAQPRESAAEIWVCIIHLFHSNSASVRPTVLRQLGSIWDLLKETLVVTQTSRKELEASEDTWGITFSICALSQFGDYGMSTSNFRVPPSWDMVVFALKHIRLTAEPGVDQTLPPHIITKRDAYVRVVIARCLILRQRWRWKLDDASLLFNHLVDIFRSRKFANLHGEALDFPAFMKTNDFGLLLAEGKGDSAFTIFLKLVVEASAEMKAAAPDDDHPNSIKKLLSLVVPVGSVPFEHSNAPRGDELSMLYNRFSTIAVAIHIDPSPVRLRQRLAHARRFVDFVGSNEATRSICMNAMMHFGIQVYRLGLPMEEILDWSGGMADSLLTAHLEIDVRGPKVRVADQKRQTIRSLEILLACIRSMIESTSIRGESTYPLPGYLQGSWVHRVLSTPGVAYDPVVGRALGQLLQTFFDARNAAIPATDSNAPMNNSESQDDYGAFDLDLEDPDVLAALGGPVEPSPNEVKENATREIIASSVSPAIYHFISKYPTTSEDDPMPKQSWDDMDEWVDRWVDYSQISVKSGKQDWSSYLELGALSWEKIVDESWRRHVGLRFMYRLLQVDTHSYSAYRDIYLKVWIVSLVCVNVNVEHQYTSLLLKTDKMEHPLLRDLPTTIDATISRTEFQEFRLPFLRVVFKHLSDDLQTNFGIPSGHNQLYLSYLASAFSAMRDNYQGKDCFVYRDFCKSVFVALKDFPLISAHSTLSYSVLWGKSMV